MSDVVATAQLRSFVERIERLNEELGTINDDKKEVFGEAKAFGYDVNALKQVIKLRKTDRAQREEFEAIVEIYMVALGEA